MEFAVLIVAFLGALLTFFSGFGLGTVLLPVMLIFLPPGTAVLCTAIIHFINNGFKFTLIRKYINVPIAIRFGIVAMIGAFIGAKCISYANDLGIAYKATWLNHRPEVSWISLIIGILLMIFALFENFKPKNLSSSLTTGQYLGGGLSGFFGGLSGHQGALRSLFLSPIIKDKNAFIATGAAIALAVDIMRISVYVGDGEFWKSANTPIILYGIAGAVIGTILGKRLLKKINYRILHITVMFSLVALGLAMVLGLV